MTPEKNIENKIRQNFEQAGGYINKVFASPNTNKGIPDLIGTLHGVYVALEIKRPHGGKPTPVQIKNLQAIANAGGLAFVTNDPNLIPVLNRHIIKHQTNQQTLKPRSIELKHLITTTQLSPSQAHHAWNFIDQPHTLQLIKPHMK